MAVGTSTVTIYHPNDDLQVSTTYKQRTLRDFIDHLEGYLAGVRGYGGSVAVHQDSTNPTLASAILGMGTPATGTVTAAAAATADTITINGTAITGIVQRATATITAAAVAVADTITIQGVVLTGIKQRATATVTAATAIAGNTVVIDGVTFTGATGAVTPGAATFSVDTGNTETATSLAAQVNAHVVTSAKLTATSSGAVVTLRSVLAGTAGNAFTLTSSGATVAVSAATLTGGIAVANNQYDVSPGATNNQVAADINRAINASTTAAILVVTSTVASAVVTVRSVLAGTGGNAYTLVSSNGTRLAVTGSGNLAGGIAVANNQWDTSPGSTNTQVGADIVRCIGASSTALISGGVTAVNVAGAVTLTSIVRGAAGNAITLASSNGTRLALTGVTNGRLIGGVNASSGALTF